MNGQAFLTLPLNMRMGRSASYKCTTKLSPLHYTKPSLTAICQPLWSDKLLFILLSDFCDSSKFDAFSPQKNEKGFDVFALSI